MLKKKKKNLKKLQFWAENCFLPSAGFRLEKSAWKEHMLSKIMHSEWWCGLQKLECCFSNEPNVAHQNLINLVRFNSK